MAEKDITKLKRFCAYKSTHYIPEDVMQDILMLSHAVVMREYMGIDEVM